MPVRFLTAAVLMLMSATSYAHEYEKGGIFIDHPWAAATFSPNVPAAIYFDIVNRSEQPDRLISAVTEIATHVEIHESTKENSVVRMKLKADGIHVPANATVSLTTGAYHVMLIGLPRKLEIGDEFPLTLRFENAGEIDVIIKVEDRMANMNHH